MMNMIIAGQVYGALTVIEPAQSRMRRIASDGRRRSTYAFWLCRCKCGREKQVRADALTCGNAKSCGCGIHRAKGTQSTWGDDDTQELRHLAAEKWSARKIAEKLNRSRNSVIGRCGRLGIPLISNSTLEEKLRQMAHAREKRQMAIKESKPPTFKRAPLPVNPAPPVAPKNLTVLELTNDTCRWPMNAPPHGGTYRFCGHDVKFGSYCEFHRAVAHGYN